MPRLTLRRSLPPQEDGTPVINNHLQFTVLHEPPAGDLPTDKPRLIKFQLEAFSVKHSYDGDWTAGGASVHAR